MTKSYISQENNLNPHILSLYDAYKSTLLAQVAIYGLPLDLEKNNVKSIYDIIKAHECEQIELSQRTIEIQQEKHTANDNYIGEYEKLVIEKAIAYNMPVVMNNLDMTKLCHEVEDYEWLLDQASNKLIDWDTSNYDPNGLQQAINDATYLEEAEYRNYVVSIRNVFQMSRGV